MLVNFGPLNILPKRIPPISDEIHINKITNKIILKCISFSPNIKIIKNINKYIAKKQLDKNCFKYFFLNNNLDNFVNSTKDNAKITTDINKYTILLINIKIKIKIKINPVFILFLSSDFN